MTVTPLHRAGDDAAADLTAFIRKVDDELDDRSELGYAVAYSDDRPGGPEILQVLDIGALLGWSAPPEVARIVVLAAGRAAGTGDTDYAGRFPVSRAYPALATAPVSVVVGIDRLGNLAGRLRLGDVVQDQAPTGGRLVDGLRRCFALPTAPPPRDTAGLLAALWLAAIAASGQAHRSHRRRMTWPEALRLHPACSLLLADEPDLPDAALEMVAGRAPLTWTWAALRRSAAANGSLNELCPSELAAWMDEGMYARWVLGAVAPEAQLAPAAEIRLDALARRNLMDLLHSQGVEVRLADV